MFTQTILPPCDLHSPLETAYFKVTVIWEVSQTHMQAEPGKPGAQVSKIKKLYTKERICLQDVRRATNHCDAENEVFVCTSLTSRKMHLTSPHAKS